MRTNSELQPIRAVFLDAAGTLIRVRESVGVTYARFARGAGIEADEAALARAFRQAWKTHPQPQRNGVPSADDERSWWRALVGDCFALAGGAVLSEHALDRFFDPLYAHFGSAEAWDVFPDVLPALNALREAGCELLVVSNFDRRLRSILEGHGLASWFDAMIISSEVGASKPDRLIFDAAVRAAGVSASACAHVGDDELCDLEGARAAGVRAHLVRRPDHGLLVLAQNIIAGAE